MKQFIIILALFVIPNIVMGQTIKGKIVDINQNPIPYTTLQIGPNYGVITNEEGVFTLEVDNFSASDKVSISCLGYKSQDYILSGFIPKTYVLIESVSELSEVFITNRALTIKEILENVRSNISKNYPTDQNQRVFMRETNNFNLKDFDFELVKSTNLKRSKIKKLNKRIDSIKGDLIGNKSSYYSDILFDLSKISDSSEISVIKAVKLIDKEKDLSTEAVNGQLIKTSLNLLDSTATYKLKSGLFTIEDSLKVGGFLNDKANPKTEKTENLKSQINGIIKNNTLNENSKLDFLFEEKGYDYTIERMTSIGDDAVYTISFKPKKRSSKYAGRLYVNASDFAVVKMEYQFAENRTGQKLNLKFLMGVKYVENAYKSTVIFKRNANETYDLQFIGQESGNYVYIDRSLKFIRNKRSEDDDKQSLKLKFMIEQNYKVKVEVFFIENNNVADFNETDEYAVDYISRYDTSIWKDYNVLSPVNAILEYKTE